VVRVSETPDIPDPLDGIVPDDEVIVPNARASKDEKSPLFFSRRNATTTPAKPRKVSVPKVRPGYFTDTLTQMYGGLGLAIMPFDPVCANSIMVSAPKCAESLDALAQQNDAVRRTLFALTRTTAIGMVFVAHMPILLAVVIHHVPAAQNYLGQMGEEMANNIAEQMKNSGPPNDGSS